MAVKSENPKLRQLFETPERKTYTVAGVTLLLTVLMVFTVIRPSVARVLTQLTENNERREVLGLMQNKLDNLETLIEMEEERKEEIDILNQELLPDSRREDEFIANIAAGASNTNVVLMNVGFIDDVSKLNIEEPSGTDAYILSVSVQGSRTDIERFVVFLENFPRLINIVEFSMTRIDRDEIIVSGATNVTRADIRAAVYFWEAN